MPKVPAPKTLIATPQTLTFLNLMRQGHPKTLITTPQTLTFLNLVRQGHLLRKAPGPTKFDFGQRLRLKSSAGGGGLERIGTPHIFFGQSQNQVRPLIERENAPNPAHIFGPPVEKVRIHEHKV